MSMTLSCPALLLSADSSDAMPSAHAKRSGVSKYARCVIDKSADVIMWLASIEM